MNLILIVLILLILFGGGADRTVGVQPDRLSGSGKCRQTVRPALGGAGFGEVSESGWLGPLRPAFALSVRKPCAMGGAPREDISHRVGRKSFPLKRRRITH